MGLLDTILGAATKYAPLVKTGVAALSTYASYKDQQKKNQLQQDAYDDYMAQADAAGHAARAAIDINYTPMTVSGVPQTKADVTDFTAVAARGGLMSVPNKQRKRYYAGTDQDEVIETDEEVLSPFDLQQETGIDFTGEQAFHDTGDDRTNAQNVWHSGAINQDNYIDFNDFFESGDWEGHISKVEVEGDMQMASDPGMGEGPFMMDEYLKAIKDGSFTGEYEDYIDQIDRSPADYMGAKGGIAGLRKGYDIGDVVTADTEEVVSEVPPSRVDQIQGNEMTEDMYNRIMQEFAEKFPDIEEEVDLDTMVAMLQASGVLNTEGADLFDIREGIKMITPESVRNSAQAISRHRDYVDAGGLAHGGRPGYAFGPGPVVDQETMAESITLPDGGEEVVTDSMTEIEGQTAGPDWYIQRVKHLEFLFGDELTEEEIADIAYDSDKYYEKVGHDPYAKGGRVKYAQGSGIMNLGGLEKDYRTTGGFVPIGAYEKKDDVPARLSKNEFVMTADAVRAAGGGSINKGAQRMYDTMKHLEANPQSQRMTA